MLTELWFTLAWWLRKPMLWLVRYRVAPDQVAARLNLDPKRPVCFVLPERSWSDLFVLDRVCRDQGLPRPHRTGNDLPTLARPGFLYLSVLLESRLESQRGGQVSDIDRLLQRAVANPIYDVQLVPVSIFWGRDPDKETSLFKLLFSDAPGAGALRKLFIIFFNGRNVLVSFGLPLAFRAYMDAELWRMQIPAEFGGTVVPASLRWAAEEMVLGANPAVHMDASGMSFSTLLYVIGTEDQ